MKIKQFEKKRGEGIDENHKILEHDFNKAYLHQMHFETGSPGPTKKKRKKVSFSVIFSFPGLANDVD